MICIVESWLSASTPNSLLVDDTNYSVFRKDRPSSPHGGACLLVNNATIKATPVDIDDKYLDTDVLCVDIINLYAPIRIIVGYRSPSSDTDADAINHTKHFIECLMSLCEVDMSIVIIGDLNFPTINWSKLNFLVDNDRCSTLFSMFVKQFCFEQYVSEMTRDLPSCRSSLLDIVLCNDSFIVNDVTVNTPFSTSDHCSVDFNLTCQTQSVNLPAHEYRNFSDADWDDISIF